MFRGKSWFSGGMWKPRNPHSLEHLKYLYHVLSKNQSVNEQNKSLLVETLRSIAEILIWGDQNDSTVFDFFLEKNMLSFFLKIMKQKCGRYVCVQLLQTLNILFENIRNETSLYYLLSNNHVNSIIVHKFDFSDEEVMAYYISFLKTLSLKLNTHTIHFFYNEHTNDFPLYTEAIKFFNHSESMVRIAVRTLTLNVFKVDDKAMLKFIRNKTAAPYFSNLVWFIGKHVLELEQCVQSYSGLQIHTKLSDLVAEHLDHLHYLNDILCLQIDALNDVLTDHLLNRLLVPLYVYSLTQHEGVSFSEEGKPHVSSVVSLFLLSQVFLIISHQPLVCQLAHIILNGDMSLFSGGVRNVLSSLKNEAGSEPEFVAPEESLEKSLETTIKSRFSSHSVSRNGKIDNSIPPSEEVTISHDHNESQCREGSTVNSIEEYNFNEGVARCIPTISEEAHSDISLATVAGANITDEEKAVAAEKLLKLNHMQLNFTLAERPFLEAVFEALDCTDSDHSALFALCLLYALGHNPGINQDLLDTVLMPSDKSETKLCYNVNLIERMIQIINLSCQYNSKVRMATLQMDILLLKQMVIKDVNSFLQDRHLAAIEQYREESSLMLRNFYKNDDIFLDMFEDEYEEMKKKPLNVEYLMMDANLLLPPMGTPMSGVEFHKRLPCGENERARRAIHVFFLLRDLSLSLRNEPESQLPLTDLSTCIKVNDVLDLTNSDLIFCTVVTKDGQKVKRFMVIDTLQLVLVEPDPKRHGWGVAKFVGFLQDIEVTGDSDDSRCLHITVHRPPNIAAGSNRLPLLVARFIVDDHIRCMAAKQRLTKGRKKARQRKMHQIASLLDLPEHIQPCPSPLRHGLRTSKDVDHSFAMHRSQSQDTGLRGKTMSPSGSRPGQYGHRPIFNPGSKVPGYATILKRDEKVFSEPGAEFTGKDNITLERKRASSSPITSRRSTSRSRESSPRQRTGSNSEEIPLEDLSRGRGSRHNSPNIRRQSSPGLPHARISAPPGMYHVHHLFTPNQSRKVATTTNLSEIVKNHEKEKKLPCRMSITSDEIFFDEGVRPSPKTLRPADTPHLTLVLDAEQGTDILPISPLLLPFHDQMSMETIDDSNGGSSNSPPDKVCTKPCCALERSHEKLDLENYRTSISDYQGGRADNTLDQHHSDKEVNEVITPGGAESSRSDACSFLNVEIELRENSLTTQKPSAASASSSAVKTKSSIQTV